MTLATLLLALLPLQLPSAQGGAVANQGVEPTLQPEAPGPVDAVTHLVRPGESIARALALAGPGDTIRLAPGDYHERLVIRVPVVVTGFQTPAGAAGESGVGGAAAARPRTTDDLPVIRGGYEGNVVRILAPGTVLDGIHVAEAGPELTKDLACILVEADSVVIRNSRVSESLHGIYVKGGNHAIIQDNLVQGRTDLLEPDRGNGIHLWNSVGDVVTGNEIVNTRDGIYFSFSDSARVTGNHVHHVRYGLHYMYSNHNTFRDNLFEWNVAGAALMYSEDIELTGNTFARCRGFRAYGLLYQSMERVTARSNLIIDNSRGIFLNNSIGNLIRSNDIVDNDLAVQLNGGSDRNTFAGNNFIHNLSPLLMDVTEMEIAWSEGGEGNFWSDYRGYDLDRDGLGDEPYRIQNTFQVMEGSTPEVRFYLLSPAAMILELAEAALPILELRDAQDPAPLMRPMHHPGVTWETLEADAGDSGRAWAGIFLAFSLVPVAGLAFGTLSDPSGRKRR